MSKSFTRHPRFDEIFWVIGYVDSHSKVHAKIIFKEDDKSQDHGSIFPNALKYKTWRWTKSNGIDDYNAIHNWLYNHGCLSSWEIKEE